MRWLWFVYGVISVNLWSAEPPTVESRDSLLSRPEDNRIVIMRDKNDIRSFLVGKPKGGFTLEDVLVKPIDFVNGPRDSDGTLIKNMCNGDNRDWNDMFVLMVDERYREDFRRRWELMYKYDCAMSKLVSKVRVIDKEIKQKYLSLYAVRQQTCVDCHATYRVE